MSRYPHLYQEIYDMIYRATTSISPDAVKIMREAIGKERNPTAKSIMQAMLDNVRLSGEKLRPLCQSPGFPTVYISFGDSSSPLEDIKQLWRDALIEGTNQHLLRPSMVDTLTRANPGDNSGLGVPNFEFDYHPAQNYLDMLVSFKGCGAELANAMKIFTVAELEKDRGFAGLKRWVLNTVIKGGGKFCPPGAIGIGLGGQMDVACKLARRTVSTRRWDDTHPDPRYADLEKELLENINSLGLGAAGIGGDTTLLAVKIDSVSTHTAIAPAAITFHCWAARRTYIRLHPDGQREILF
ncbi:fumarate hydratase [Fretibacterium sp. OH1220_COT-178]|uniref:fumarate hydratase n=1 Tax=Fretibacterium sp. OH1220_COT-178 TaxID=2491047 RepID=UPI0018F604DB|nr:fumarate hydratase [Fretibacterium sp. OH1220_COT-178]